MPFDWNGFLPWTDTSATVASVLSFADRVFESLVPPNTP
jgi:hypothetical protein